MAVVPWNMTFNRIALVDDPVVELVLIDPLAVAPMLDLEATAEALHDLLDGGCLLRASGENTAAANQLKTDLLIHGPLVRGGTTLGPVPIARTSDVVQATDLARSGCRCLVGIAATVTMTCCSCFSSRSIRALSRCSRQ
jgi:hypothetical protein